jgi:hypothetical protein
MKNKMFVLLNLLYLMALCAACSARNEDVNVSNFRLALDQAGEDVTSTFFPTDVIYVVADLVEVPRGTKLEAKWIAVNAEGTKRNHEIDTETINITDEIFTGSIFFQLSNAVPWPLGQYRVDLYVNDALAESLEFSVQ